MKGIFNFIRHCRIYGFRETFEKWKYNYYMLDTPEQLLKKEIIGYIGGIGGLLLAMVMFTVRGMWFVCIAMGFSIFIMYAQLKGKLKSLQILRDVQKDFNENKEE